MARTFPYEDAAVYLAWKELRGQRYARGMFEGVSGKTFWTWEQRHRTDTKLQSLAQAKRDEMGIAELRTDTMEYIRWGYAHVKEIGAIARDCEDPRRVAALAEWAKAVAMMSKIAGDVNVDTEPMPPPPPEALSR